MSEHGQGRDDGLLTDVGAMELVGERRQISDRGHCVAPSGESDMTRETV